jgi:Tol biopolymer transport system component
MLFVAAAIVAAAIALAIVSGGAASPGGTIGYRAGDTEAWIKATGERSRAPESWTPPTPTSRPWYPELGPAQFPSPDGRAVAFVHTTDDRPWRISRLMVREGERITELAQLGDAHSPSLLLGGKAGARSRDGVPLVVAWSPDGRALAWGSLAELPYNLSLAERGSWKTLEGGYAGELAWSPDGRHLAISTYAEDRTDHTVLVLEMHGGGPPKRLAKGCVMVWSPDSRHLALHGEPRSQPGLWVVSVDGRATQVMDRLGVVPFAWVE